MPDLTPRAAAEAQARREREAAALRENLRRRKAQGRARENETKNADIRIRDVIVSENELCVSLMDGRTITAPLAWYPRLANATPAQRAHWQRAGAGYEIHWPDLDEDLSTEQLLLGRRAPPGSEQWRSPFLTTDS